MSFSIAMVRKFPVAHGDVDLVAMLPRNAGARRDPKFVQFSWRICAAAKRLQDNSPIMIWLAPAAPPRVEIFRHAKPELVALMLLGVGKAIAGWPVGALVTGWLRGADKVVAPYNGEQCSTHASFSMPS